MPWNRCKAHAPPIHAALRCQSLCNAVNTDIKPGALVSAKTVTDCEPAVNETLGEMIDTYRFTKISKFQNFVKFCKILGPLGPLFC